jgi:hypothetical protein
VQKLRKNTHSIPLSILILFKVFWWLTKGIFEQVIFDKIVKAIGEWSSNVLLDWIPILGIVGILIWTYIDARNQFRSSYLQDTLTKMHRRLIEITNSKLSNTFPSIRQMNDIDPPPIN